MRVAMISRRRSGDRLSWPILPALSASSRKVGVVVSASETCAATICALAGGSGRTSHRMLRLRSAPRRIGE